MFCFSALYSIYSYPKKSVSGGEYRDAASRSAPGLNAPVVASLPNDTAVKSKGYFTYAASRNWAEIIYPVRRWIKASILAYAY